VIDQVFAFLGFNLDGLEDIASHLIGFACHPSDHREQRKEDYEHWRPRYEQHPDSRIDFLDLIPHGDLRFGIRDLLYSARY
jgi:hypothetical protein